MTENVRIFASILTVAYFTCNGADAQTCYNCNYFQASSTDPGLQTALGQMSSRNPSYTLCANFPYYSSGSVPTIDCATLNMSAFGAPLGGMPFTGWMCMKQAYTVTLKNYEDGNTLVVPAVVRGCAPYQYQNPYTYYSRCFPMSDTTNPYVRAVITSLYFPQQNVGPILGNTGSTENTGTNSGQVCLCYGSKCNGGNSVRPAMLVHSLGALLLVVIPWL
jgi:hypothetical protein